MPKNSIINNNQSCKIIDHAKNRLELDTQHLLHVYSVMCGQWKRHSNFFKFLWFSTWLKVNENCEISSPEKKKFLFVDRWDSGRISEPCSTSLGFHSTFFRCSILEFSAFTSHSHLLQKKTTQERRQFIAAAEPCAQVDSLPIWKCIEYFFLIFSFHFVARKDDKKKCWRREEENKTKSQYGRQRFQLAKKGKKREKRAVQHKKKDEEV